MAVLACLVVLVEGCALLIRPLRIEPMDMGPQRTGNLAPLALVGLQVLGVPVLDLLPHGLLVDVNQTAPPQEYLAIDDELEEARP